MMSTTEEAAFETWQCEAVATELDRVSAAKKQALKDIEASEAPVVAGTRPTAAKKAAVRPKQSVKKKKEVSCSDSKTRPPPKNRDGFSGVALMRLSPEP